MAEFALELESEVEPLELVFVSGVELVTTVWFVYGNDVFLLLSAYIFVSGMFEQVPIGLS
jgi:hypothetical protein